MGRGYTLEATSVPRVPSSCARPVRCSASAQVDFSSRENRRECRGACFLDITCFGLTSLEICEASVGPSRGITVGLTPRSLSQSLSSPVQVRWAHPCPLGGSWHLVVIPMLRRDAMPLSRSYSVMGLRWGLRSLPPFLNSTVLAWALG